MQSDAPTVDAYLNAVAEDRREEVRQVLSLVRAHLPEGYEEAMSWGMICWEVPLALSGKTYNGKPLMYAALASQKRHIALYLCGANCIPGLKGDLRAAFAESGKKFDMGAACLRFRRFADIVPEAVAATLSAVPVTRFVAASKR
ncbi:MAG: DUF1801 domain-containing protein [Pseudomonadota bacterium]